MNTTSILIVGVGGQGTLLSSRILGKLAEYSGYDVKVSEVHGMAQRGGSVVTYVRMGEEVASPIIEEGGADYMLSFEKLEALRYVNLMKKNGKMVVNQQRIDPMPVISGTAEYPQEIMNKLSSKIEVHEMDAVDIANEIGNIRVVNTIMIGKLAKIMGNSKEIWLKAIKECVPPKTVDINIEAFNRGYQD
ncbi:MAG: indolepyruvate oxidoreductase subunit beta [Clostridiales bacterium]|nr:indolepyruvate oxidoreductase subunit beta [Clostridiales bacterium]